MGNSNWWSRDIGYTQIGDKWWICLRRRTGDLTDDDLDSETVWRFSRAPSWMQNEAIAKIPDLLDTLTQQAQETRKKLKNRAEQAFQLTAIIEEVNKNEDDWLSKLQSALSNVGLLLSAEALAQPEVEVMLVNNNELKIKAPRRCKLHVAPEQVKRALTHLGYPDLRFSIALIPDRKNEAEQSANEGKSND